MEETELKQLIDNVKNGKIQDFEKIIKQYEKLVFKILHLKLPAHLLSSLEDLAQEVFLTLFDKISSYKPAYSFTNWLYTITLNKVRNFVKQESRREHRALDESHQAPEKSHTNTIIEGQEALKQAIGELPEKYQQVLFLYYSESMKINEIADNLDISLNTVKTWLKRAKDKLAKNTQLKNIFETFFEESGKV